MLFLNKIRLDLYNLHPDPSLNTLKDNHVEKIQGLCARMNYFNLVRTIATKLWQFKHDVSVVCNGNDIHNLLICSCLLNVVATAQYAQDSWQFM